MYDEPFTKAMTMKWTLTVVTILLVALFAMGYHNNTSYLEAKLAVEKSTIKIDSLKRVADSIYKIRVPRAKIAYRTKTVYDTVRVRDTLVHNDTVYIPRVVADSAVQTCHLALKSCTAQVEVHDSLYTALQQRDTAVRVAHEQDLKSTKVRWLAFGALFGFALSRFK